MVGLQSVAEVLGLGVALHLEDRVASEVDRGERRVIFADLCNRGAWQAALSGEWPAVGRQWTAVSGRSYATEVVIDWGREVKVQGVERVVRCALPAGVSLVLSLSVGVRCNLLSGVGLG